MLIKKGRIHDVNHYNEWMISNGCVLTTLLLDTENIRLYYTQQTSEGGGNPHYIDVYAEDRGIVKYVHDNPLLQPGELINFSDREIMPCSILRLSYTCIYLYYVGWNASVMVPYQNASGLAISQNNGKTFKKALRRAIVERNIDEPFFSASSYVIRQNDNWMMWHASSTESHKGMHWVQNDVVAAIEFSSEGLISTMQICPSVVEVKKRKFLFYNGNGFDKTGIRYAVWK